MKGVQDDVKAKNRTRCRHLPARRNLRRRGRRADSALRDSNSGLATVKDSETIKFHFTLDDVTGTPPAVVSMQLLNENGGVVTNKVVTLNPGQSSTLESTSPGLRRAMPT